jgi:hypothetical protein
MLIESVGAALIAPFTTVALSATTRTLVPEERAEGICAPAAPCAASNVDKTNPAFLAAFTQ